MLILRCDQNIQVQALSRSCLKQQLLCYISVSLLLHELKVAHRKLWQSTRHLVQNSHQFAHPTNEYRTIFQKLSDERGETIRMSYISSQRGQNDESGCGMQLRAGTVLVRVRITTADNLTGQDLSSKPEEQLNAIEHDQTDGIHIKKVGLRYIKQARTNTIDRSYF